MPKNKRRFRIAQRPVDPSVRQMVSVYAFGQSFYTKPLCVITREQRDQWISEGSGAMREFSGALYDHGRVLELSKPTTDRLLVGNSALGACLIWAIIRGDKEAKAKLKVLRYRSTADHNRFVAA